MPVPEAYSSPFSRMSLKSKYALVDVSSLTFTSETSFSLQSGDFSLSFIEISEITHRNPSGRMSNAAICLSVMNAATEFWKYANADVRLSL